MILEHLRMWRARLTQRIPDYGVRRSTELRAVIRYELSLLFNRRTESIEVATGLFAIAFGVQIARQPPDFNPAYYGHLVSLMPSGVWAVLMLFCGIDKILAMLTATKWCRRMLAALMTTVWAYIAAICWISAPHSIASGIYTVLAILCGWTYVRLHK
jgi:hypothetical protein